MTNLLEKKMELETLYNQLLMQHESLPSEIHKEWNQKAMDCIDEGLTKIEKELTIELEFPTYEEVEKAETVKENTAETFFYLEKEILNKKNHYGTVINEVKRKSKNEVIIFSKVNVDPETVFTFRNVYIETSYNLKSGKMKSKATSYNYRKDIGEAKKQVEDFIKHLIAQKLEYKEDLSEAKHITTMYYYNLLKLNGCSVNVTNELDNLVNYKMLSVKEIAKWVTEKLEKQVA